MSLDLTVVIPVHDDEPYLMRLLDRLARLGLADRIIVADDGSETPLDPGRLCDAAGLDPSRLTLVRQPQSRGAGAARNMALEQVETRHLLFLDADDLPARDLSGLLADLAGRDFDFCLFQHHDSRMDKDRIRGQMPFDQDLWTRAGLAFGALSEVSQEAACTLARTANYPWNKIYRTAFLHRHGIRCSETRVHNDIELHWRSFLNAERILASDRIGVMHMVSDGGDRLTNRRGNERLAVFGPLEAVATEIATGTGELYAEPFFRFVLNLLGWIRGNLEPELQERFAQGADAFLERHMPDHIRVAIAETGPVDPA